MGAVQRTLNVRLAPETYDALRQLSTSRTQSMNKVVEVEILAAAEKDRNERQKRAFERIAAQPQEEQSVEFAFEAQREVVIGQE